MKLALDLDGTLISCEPRQSAVLQAVLAQCGERVDLGRVWELKRNGASTEQALVQLGFDPTSARRASRSWRYSIEAPFWLGLDSVFSGVTEVLGAMRAVGWRLIVVTARSQREWVPQQLERLGLSPWLDGVVVVPPHEAATEKAAVLRDLSAVAFFGDTESDYGASRAAGVPFYSVGGGQRCAAFLARAGVKQVHLDLAAAWSAFLTETGRKSDS
ncbi:MAG: HAD family hydrolase [Verrucomicrobia bacterium]|nr:MAG: HAD family hydrolase [Verrucomicrobiota bacterium]